MGSILSNQPVQKKPSGHAAKANQSIFYTAEGRARSAAEVVKLVRDRFSGQMDRYAEVAATIEGPEAVDVKERGHFTEVRAAMAKTEKPDTNKAMIDHFILEEMAKLIAVKPMTMSDGSEDEQNGDETTGLSAGGFQGADWAAAMSKSLTKDKNVEAADARNRAGEAKRTYDMLNAVPTSLPGAPFMPIRRNDPS